MILRIGAWAVVFPNCDDAGVIADQVEASVLPNLDKACVFHNWDSISEELTSIGLSHADEP